MQEQMQMMKNRKVWHLVKPPYNKQIFGNRWVYAIKRDEAGNIVWYKARLVAQGYRQIKGESFDETFAPVVDFAVIGFFLLVYWCHI